MVPSEVDTVTGTVPLPGGACAVISVGETTSTSVASLLPKCTAVAELTPTALSVTAVPPDAIPGILGSTRLGTARQWTTEFGADDGVGPVVLGDIAAAKTAGACKVRGDLQIWCALPGADSTGAPAL